MNKLLLASGLAPTTRFVTTAIACACIAAASTVASAAAPIIATPTAGLATFPSGTDTFSIGADGHIRELTANGSVWTTFDVSGAINALPALPGSPLSSFQANDYQWTMFYLANGGQVQKLTRLTSTMAWTALNVSAAASVAPGGAGGIVQPAISGSPLSSIYLDGGHFRTYYIDVLGHVQELADTPGGGWVSTDLTAATRSVGPISGSSLTAMVHTEAGESHCVSITTDACKALPAQPTYNNQYPRIYYFDYQNHVQELAWGGDGNWHATDITTASGAPAAVAGSAVSSFDWLSGSKWYPRVYFFDAGQHVRELAWGAGRWSATDVSASAGAVAAVQGSSMVAIPWLGGHATASPKVYYFSYDGHVQELQWYSGWRVSDISALTCAPAAAAGSQITSFWYHNIPSGVAYATADSHIHELTQTSSWSQYDLNGAGTAQGCSPSVGRSGGGGGSSGGIRNAN